MDFITGLPPTIFKKSYIDTILIIVNQFIKFTLFFLVAIIINITELVELFYTYIKLYFRLSNGIISNKSSIFISKF